MNGDRVISRAHASNSRERSKWIKGFELMWSGGGVPNNPSDWRIAEVRARSTH
jgi:hypothetical protein